MSYKILRQVCGKYPPLLKRKNNVKDGTLTDGGRKSDDRYIFGGGAESIVICHIRYYGRCAENILLSLSAKITSKMAPSQMEVEKVTIAIFSGEVRKVLS